MARKKEDEASLRPGPWEVELPRWFGGPEPEPSPKAGPEPMERFKPPVKTEEPDEVLRSLRLPGGGAEDHGPERHLEPPPEAREASPGGGQPGLDPAGAPGEPEGTAASRGRLLSCAGASAPYSTELPAWVGGFEPPPEPRPGPWESELPHWLWGQEPEPRPPVHPFRQIFRGPLYLLTAVAGGLGLYALYYGLLRQVTTLQVFNEMAAGQPLYLYAYHGLTVAASLLFGMALAVALYTLRLRAARRSRLVAANAGGGFAGAMAAACPVCGSFLLQALGVAGGIGVLPLAGLELKAASAGLFGFALLSGLRGISRACDGGTCAAPPKPRAWSLALPAAAIVLTLLLFVPLVSAEFSPQVQSQAYMNLLQNMNADQAGGVQAALQGVHQAVLNKVLPPEGFQTRIRWGNSNIIPRLVELGVIDIERFERAVGGLTPEQRRILTDPGYDGTLRIDANNSWFMVTVLWPLGIANKNPVLEKSPMLNGGWSIFNFASTGGWNLGNEPGGAYYNRFELVNLTPQQQSVLEDVAPKVFRPCCNNPTSFPDCNHGAAMLALLTLGASQGLSRAELFEVAKAFNSFWYPQQYAETALYLKFARGLDWDRVPAEQVVGGDYSSISGWLQNVDTPLKAMNLTMGRGGARCGA